MARKNGPWGPIFFLLLEVVPLSLKMSFHVNLVETCSKLDEKLTFDLILALLEAILAPKFGPRGPFFTHT